MSYRDFVSSCPRIWNPVFIFQNVQIWFYSWYGCQVSSGNFLRCEYPFIRVYIGSEPLLCDDSRAIVCTSVSNARHKDCLVQYETISDAIASHIISRIFLSDLISVIILYRFDLCMVFGEDIRWDFDASKNVSGSSNCYLLV